MGKVFETPYLNFQFWFPIKVRILGPFPLLFTRLHLMMNQFLLKIFRAQLFKERITVKGEQKILRYLPDRDLSSEWRYPSLKQPESGISIKYERSVCPRWPRILCSLAGTGSEHGIRSSATRILTKKLYFPLSYVREKCLSFLILIEQFLTWVSKHSNLSSHHH